jgi:hypothetical protein
MTQQTRYYTEFKISGQIFYVGEYLCFQSPLLFGRGGEAVREKRGKSLEGCGASHLGGEKEKPYFNQSCATGLCVNSKHALMARGKHTGHLNSPDPTHHVALSCA